MQVLIYIEFSFHDSDQNIPRKTEKQHRQKFSRLLKINFFDRWTEMEPVRIRLIANNDTIPSLQ